MENLKIEKRNGMYYIAGDFRREIENVELNGLHLEECNIVEYNEDGVWFETNRCNSKVYYTNGIGETEQILLDEYSQN